MLSFSKQVLFSSHNYYVQLLRINGILPVTPAPPPIPMSSFNLAPYKSHFNHFNFFSFPAFQFSSNIPDNQKSSPKALQKHKQKSILGWINQIFDPQNPVEPQVSEKGQQQDVSLTASPSSPPLLLETPHIYQSQNDITTIQKNSKYMTKKTQPASQFSGNDSLENSGQIPIHPSSSKSSSLTKIPKLRYLVGLQNNSMSEKQRHNAGGAFINFLAKQYFGLSPKWSKGPTSKSKWYQLKLTNNTILVKPKGFINQSGQKMKPLLSGDIDNVLIFCDDLERDVGKISWKNKGSHNGHNGIRDIIKTSGSHSFSRVRIGIGRPTSRNSHAVSDYVLKDFPTVDWQYLHQKVFPDLFQELIDKDILPEKDEVMRTSSTSTSLHTLE